MKYLLRGLKMAQWGIELTSNDTALLSFLVQYRKEPSWSVVEFGGKYYLLSSSFQGLTSPDEVRQKADNLLFPLNGIMILKFKYAHLDKAGNVIYLDDNGQLIQTTKSINMSGRINVSAGVTYYQSTDAQQLSSMDIWLKAQSNPTVWEALQHYANPHNWFNLYKVYEVIKKDTTRLERNRTISRGTFDKLAGGRRFDFEESANKERHSSLGYHPKPGITITYMSLQEAEEFVRGLLLLWLQSK
jgi:hypothetical protein